jgi:hypothetical protein
MAPKKNEPAPDDRAQSERFIETAKKVAVDGRGSAFARAFKKIVPRKKRRRS